MHGRMQWFGVDVSAPPGCHPEGVIDASDMRKGEVPMNPGIRREGYLFVLVALQCHGDHFLGLHHAAQHQFYLSVTAVRTAGGCSGFTGLSTGDLSTRSAFPYADPTLLMVSPPWVAP